jgi:hypothetical protein
MSTTTGRIYLGATLIASGVTAMCGQNYAPTSLIDFSAAYAQHGAGLWQAIGYYQPVGLTPSGTLGTASLHAVSLYF